MQAMSYWYLLKCHDGDIYQHLSSMPQRILLLNDRSSIVQQVHARHLPPVYRVLKLSIMCCWHL